MKKVLAPVSLLAVWEICALIANKPILPQPWKVFAAMVCDYPLQLLQNTGASLLRVLCASAVSAVLGLTCAILGNIYPKLDKVIYQAVYLLHPIPKIALLPVIMLLFGLGEGSKILLLVLICFFPFCLTARDALMSIDPAHKLVFQSLGATKTEIIRYLLLPSASLSLLESFRLCLGTAFSVLFFSESFGRQLGLGSFILDAWMRVSYLEMFAGISALSLVCFGMYMLIDILSKKIKRL